MTGRAWRVLCVVLLAAVAAPVPRATAAPTGTGIAVDGAVDDGTLMRALGAATATHPAVRDNLPPGATVEDIIRFVWPDDLESRAVRIAYRESRFVPTARNACCYGIFQINWRVHRSWLADIGVTSAQQLLDPGVNARAALALYDRDGWHPWQL